MSAHAKAIRDDLIKGKLIIVSAPSGAGKTTIVRALMQAIPDLVFSVSACSRPPRHNEVDGKDYFFLDEQQFKKSIEEGAFLEWEEVYPGRFYGTLKSEVDRQLADGKDIIFDVDVKGGLNIKAQYGRQALAIFIMPPSPAILEQRLRGRSTEDEETIQIRLGKAKEELSQASLFDLIIKNEDLPLAIATATDAVRTFVSRQVIPEGKE